MILERLQYAKVFQNFRIVFWCESLLEGGAMLAVLLCSAWIGAHCKTCEEIQQSHAR